MKYNLKALRGLKDLSQAEAAQLVGVSEYKWRNWEHAKSFPDVPEIQAIEKAFNVSYDDIIFLPKVTV